MFGLCILWLFKVSKRLFHGIHSYIHLQSLKTKLVLHCIKCFNSNKFMIMYFLHETACAGMHNKTLGIHIPSQVGSGLLQKWFFSQTSGSSWLSLYPRSHWKDTVEPMDRSWLNRAPFTGIPGSIQEYVSNVTTREIKTKNVISSMLRIDHLIINCSIIMIKEYIFWVYFIAICDADIKYQVTYLHCHVSSGLCIKLNNTRKW